MSGLDTGGKVDVNGASQVSWLDMDRLIDDRGVRIIVCCGSGGVGKTTTAAALGLRAADRGRAVCVLTVDPARRLAQAMGLTKLDNSPRRVPGAGSDSGGSLDAMMLDMKRTFDELVIANSGPEAAERVLNNPFYKTLSGSFAGTQEYMAMEKLSQLSKQADAEGTWDLIIVDTPPARSALDFLDAPKRMGSFLDGRLMRVLVGSTGKPGAARMANAGLAVGAKVIGKLVGGDTLRDVQEVSAALNDVLGNFSQRADETYERLKSSDARFLIVSAGEPEALREAEHFISRLAAERMPLAGLVLNRMLEYSADDLSSHDALRAARRLEKLGESDPTAQLLRAYSANRAQAERQSICCAAFLLQEDRIAVAVSPERDTDIHDLAGLREVGDRLIESDLAQFNL